MLDMTDEVKDLHYYSTQKDRKTVVNIMLHPVVLEAIERGCEDYNKKYGTRLARGDFLAACFFSINKMTAKRFVTHGVTQGIEGALTARELKVLKAVGEPTKEEPNLKGDPKNLCIRCEKPFNKAFSKHCVHCGHDQTKPWPAV